MSGTFDNALALIKMVISISKRLDVSTIRRKSGFTGNRVVKIVFDDTGLDFTMMMTNNDTLKLLIWPRTPNVVIHIASLCVFKHIRLGYVAGMDPATMERINMPYAPLDAWKFGDVAAEGDASTNDVLGFVNVLLEIMHNIDVDEICKIVGSCEHD